MIFPVLLFPLSQLIIFSTISAMFLSAATRQTVFPLGYVCTGFLKTGSLPGWSTPTEPRGGDHGLPVL
jgi:hypothetical protein